jgi:hypothetical protein
MNCFAFVTCAPETPSANFATSRSITRTYGGRRHARGQASFEAKTDNQSRRRDGAGRCGTESFAGGERIRIHDAHC